MLLPQDDSDEETSKKRKKASKPKVKKPSVIKVAKQVTHISIPFTHSLSD